MRGETAPTELHTCVPSDSIKLTGERGSPREMRPGDRVVSNDGMERALLDVMTCIRLGTTLEEAGRALWVHHEPHLKAPVAMAPLFRDLPNAIATTRAIAERCAFTLKGPGYRFPDYPIPPPDTAHQYRPALPAAG